MRKIRIGCFIIFLLIAMSGLVGIAFLFLKFHSQEDANIIVSCKEQLKISENGQPALNEETLEEEVEYKPTLRSGETIISKVSMPINSVYEEEKGSRDERLRILVLKSSILLFIAVFFIILCLLIPLGKDEVKEPLRI